MTTPVANPYVTATAPAASSSQGSSVASTANQFLAANNASGSNAYFGPIQQTGQNPYFPNANPGGSAFQSNGGKTYGPYDPSSLAPVNGLVVGPTVGQPLYIDTTAAANMYYNWTPQQQNNFRAKLTLVDSSYANATDKNLADAWASYVNQSAASHAAGKDKTPWDILASDISSVSGAGNGSKLANADIKKTVTNTQLTSAPDANAIFQAAAQSLIGRAPTTDEMKAFQSNLNSQERANPAVSQIETQYDANGNVQSQATTGSSGGVSDSAKALTAQNDLRGTSEYANYQASTTYMGALQELLGGGKV